VLEDERCFAKIRAGSQLPSVEESAYPLSPRLIAQTNLAPVQLGKVAARGLTIGLVLNEELMHGLAL
jgi:hypothetical protein